MLPVKISCFISRMRTWSTFPRATHARGKNCLRLQIWGAAHSIVEFQIPLYREDLLQPSGGSQFFVSELLPAREIVSRLEGRPSNACPSPCPSLPPSLFLLYTLTSRFPFCYVSVVPCLIMHASGTPRYSNILSRMQVTAGLRCHSLHS